MNQVPEQGAYGEALKQAMNELMERVREDVQAQERLLAQDPQAAERAARLRILLNEAKKRLQNADQPTPQGTGDPAAGS
ncbi:MAG: hypothetical protein KJ565_11565 [Gammaproteobacteria bacterium]|uniref:hypothetical protein n=1 Tax=Hydrogenophaga sp. TaxID=1904254 RepID=UPI0025BAEFD0|nr:hypothetical protein [Hydrogenophaga sp.]MBU4182327.1 hypothetical protein [Gammaproteobacteria bacterium]MBU4279874.1 hypothetical protein [Gammaproteobacteria bacterium]MBU4324237.1 hypothetical protein [Gammaproteobacteria bacterium]MBU4507169.1 hypothetical protein [Gammaproteobacteria bacterium]MCG2657519.1 hypothetical protein [Hydrogenophaga sp.]